MDFNLSHYDKELLEAIIRFNAQFIELYSECSAEENTFRQEYESLKILINEWKSRGFKESGTIEWAIDVIEKYEMAEEIRLQKNIAQQANNSTMFN